MKDTGHSYEEVSELCQMYTASKAAKKLQVLLVEEPKGLWKRYPRDQCEALERLCLKIYGTTDLVVSPLRCIDGRIFQIDLQGRFSDDDEQGSCSVFYYRSESRSSHVATPALLLVGRLTRYVTLISGVNSFR